jgi:hypothetical protein
MSVLDLQRFAIESAMQSGKSFRIEADGTLVFDVQGTDVSVTKLTKRDLIDAPKERVYAPVAALNGKERLTVVDILTIAAKVGETIKIKTAYNTVWSAMRTLGMEGKIVKMSRGICKFTRTA